MIHSSSGGSGEEAAEVLALASGRVDAVRHLLDHRQFRDSLRVSAQPALRNSALVGVQAALAAAIALPLVHLSPRPDLIGFASLGTLVALFGRFAPAGGRTRIVVLAALLQVFSVLGMSAAVRLGAPPALQMLLLALASGVFVFLSVTGRFGPPGALIFIFAAGASMGEVASWAIVLERSAATAIVAALAVVICVATEHLRQQECPEAPFPSDPMQPVSHRLVASSRIALGAAIAVFVAHLAGAGHPAWAAMGAVAVMQGAHLHITMNRALQRMVGTVLGAGLVWLALMQDPSVWSVIAMIAVLQVATELVIGANYGLGQVLVTPMALLMTYLATHGAADASMAPERVFDTLLGAGIGIALAVAASTLDDRKYLAQRHAARAGS